MRIKFTALALVASLAAFKADAQLNRVNKRIEYNGKRQNGLKYPLWQRIGIGYGTHFLFNKADFTYRTVNQQVYSTSAALKSNPSMVGSLDIYLPVSHYSDRSCFAIGIGVNYIASTLTHDTISLSNTSLQRDLKAAIIGVPISLELKTGGDAAQSKAYGTMFTIGAGIQPMYIQSEGFESEGSKSIDQDAKILSFIKAEAGFRAGLAFKLRAMAYIGSLTLIDKQETIIKEGTTETILGYRRTTSTGPLGYTLQLIVMPGALGWRK